MARLKRRLPKIPTNGRFYALLSVPLAIAGCAVENYKPAPAPVFMSDSAALPPRSAGNLSTTAEANSVSAQPASSMPETPQRQAAITLQDAIAETLSSPAILAAAENVTQASAVLWTVSTPPNPTLNVSQTLNPLTRSFTPTRQGGPPQFDAGISFPIDWLVFGKREAAMDSARLNTDVAGADFADMIRLRLAATIAVFYDALEAKQLLALAQQDAEHFRRIAALTEQQVRLGGAASIEADRIRLALLDSEREAQRRSAAVQIAMAALKAALGRGNDTAALDVQGQLDVAQVQEPLNADAAFQLAEQYRPDIVATQLKIAKAEADVRFEERKALPHITPSAGYTRQFQEKAIGYPDANSWGVGLAVSVPIFDRNHGGIGKANSLLVQSRHNFQDQLAQLRGEIAQAAENFKLAQTFVKSDTTARIAAAKSVRDRIETAYKEGGRSVLEMLDAQRTYRDFARSATIDQAAYWKALHRLNAAIGKQTLK